MEREAEGRLQEPPKEDDKERPWEEHDKFE